MATERDCARGLHSFSETMGRCVVCRQPHPDSRRRHFPEPDPASQDPIEPDLVDAYYDGRTIDPTIDPWLLAQ